MWQMQQHNATTDKVGCWQFALWISQKQKVSFQFYF